jgi:hypothetical protein
MSDDLEKDAADALENKIHFKPEGTEEAPHERNMTDEERDAERYTD